MSLSLSLPPSPNSDWFSRNWLKLTKMIPSSSMPLSNMLFLSNELSRFVKDGSMEREMCSTLWTSLANELTSFIAKVMVSVVHKFLKILFSLLRPVK